MVQSWIRGTFGGAAAALLAPLLLIAAAALAAGGGGLGGVSSLGQLTSGPDLPDAGIELAGPDTGIENASVPGVENRLLAASNRPAPLAAPGTSAIAPGAGLAAASPGGATGPVPSGPVPTGSGPVASVPSGGGTTTGSGPTTGAPPSGGALEGVLGGTRDLGNAVPQPLRPVTDPVLDTLLGPPRR